MKGRREHEGKKKSAGIGFADWKREEFIMMENERIRIYPASQEQMEKFIASETDKELKKAYREMLKSC